LTPASFVDFKQTVKRRYYFGNTIRKFENVCFRYPDAEQDTIHDFNLHVQPGECIAFVGSSGSGKSTIMNMIIGFLMPKSGQLLIDGKPIEALSLSDYRHFVSVVPQNSILMTGTIRDNITYGMPGISEETIQKAVEMANLNEFLSELPNGLDTVVGEHGDKLSGGQKQRICIARALIRDPKILILDEATSALDNISEFHVQKAISSLIKGRTTFIVAHRLSTIRDADRIVVMENGTPVEIGSYDELMEKKGKFYELKSLSDMNVEDMNE
ncbi:MAG: ATP-binding cassette domain-containing protein, partial [Clostridia bacterium]|nr:ATP-binding cassette domain-containing protein [Clostridia bacterium]